MRLLIPSPSLVVLLGAAGSGKSTLAARHFGLTQVLSSDRFRAMVCDDESNQRASEDAFAVLMVVAQKRLARHLLTVVDATNVKPSARAPLVALARAEGVAAVALAISIPEALCRQRIAARAGLKVPADTLRKQCQTLKQSLPFLEREGFGPVHVLRSPEEVDAVDIAVEPTARAGATGADGTGGEP